MKKLIISISLIGLLMLLGGIVFYGMNPPQYTGKQVNLFLFINHSLSLAGNLFWQNITALGDALLLFPLLSFFILKNMRAWAAFFGAIPLATILSRAGKSFFTMPRPAAVIDNEQINIIGQTLRGASSLPSGHTVTIFAVVAVLICLLFCAKKKTKHPIAWSFALFSIGVVVALSRVAVGAHWPFDLVLGAIFGSIGGLSGVMLTYKYAAWWRWMTTAKAKYIHAAILLLLSIAMLVEYSQLVLAWLAVIVVSIVIFKLLTMRENHALHT